MKKNRESSLGLMTLLMLTSVLLMAESGYAHRGKSDDPTFFPPPDGDAWGNSLWTHRRALIIHGVGNAVKALPMSIPLAEIVDESRRRNLSLASLRVIGPKGEVPCQIDEFDSAGQFQKRSNHRSDAEDRLVFQIDVPANGQNRYWLYWSTTSLPMGRYPIEVMAHPVVEPNAFKGDLMMHHRRCLVAVQGPARHEDPTKNVSENWGGGSIVYCEIDRFPVVRGGWTNLLPNGGVSTRPSKAAACWTIPETLVNGPVRTGLVTLNPEAELSPKNAVTCRAERRIWLYETGAWVAFDEFLSIPKNSGKYDFRYEIRLCFGDHPGDRISYSVNGSLATFSPTEELLRQAREENKIIFSKANLAPWMAGWSKEHRNGYAVIAIPREMVKGEKQQTSCYCRKETYFRLSRTFSATASEEQIQTRLLIMGLKDQEGERAAWSAYRFLAEKKWSWGSVEERGVK